MLKKKDDDDAVKAAIKASELEELGRWADLVTTLRASAIEVAGPATPPLQHSLRNS
jgi:hypothetical protein